MHKHLTYNALKLAPPGFVGRAPDLMALVTVLLNPHFLALDAARRHDLLRRNLHPRLLAFISVALPDVAQSQFALAHDALVQLVIDLLYFVFKFARALR
jgi:hypothetical protein